MSKMRSRRVTAWRHPLVWRLTGVTGRSTEVATTWLTLDGAALVNPSYHSVTKVSWILLSNRLFLLSKGNRSVGNLSQQNITKSLHMGQGHHLRKNFVRLNDLKNILKFLVTAHPTLTRVFLVRLQGGYYKRHLPPLSFREFSFLFFCF